MADPLVKAVVDAIAESDNEIGGQLITRLRESHIHGNDVGSLASASPTRLTSAVDVFQSTDVGKLVDLLQPLVGAAHGFEGTYIVATFVDAKNVTLTKIDASAPAFTDVSNVRWRFSTLRVESTLEFKQKDRQMQVWAGEEPYAIPYAGVDQTPGAQEFKGLGPNRLYVFGKIDGTAPTTLSSVGTYFQSSDIGKTVWILAEDTPNGNEGPQLITAVASDGKSATVSPGGLTTSQDPVWFAIKDYEVDVGYLTGLRPSNNDNKTPRKERRALTELSPVVDGSQSYSAVDQLRRAMLTDYATEEELDRIGRNLGVERPRGLDDERYRCLLQVLTYLPKTTIYGIELVLECLFPGGDYSVYEDLINFPNTVFIEIEALQGNSTDHEGKAFLAPTGADVTPPIDPGVAGGTALGPGDRERVTSATATTLSVTHEPITVNDVVREDNAENLDMSALPSAASPAWTFVGQNGGVEGTVFSLAANGALEQTQTASTTEGGYYSRALSASEQGQTHPGSKLIVRTWWRYTSAVEYDTYPWSIRVEDDQIDALYAINWTLDGFQIAALTPILGTFDGGDLSIDEWHRFEIHRRTEGIKHLITFYVDGKAIAKDLDASLFTTAAANVVQFGYFDQSPDTQDWTCQWDNFEIVTQDSRNFYNLTREDGVFSGTNSRITSAAGLFLAADATGGPDPAEGKHIRIWGARDPVGNPSKNIGIWRVASFVGASELELEGIPSGNVAAVSTVGSDNFVTLLDPLFIREDLGKQLEILNSIASPTNNGTRIVLEVINPYQVRVDGGAFIAEDELSYKFNPWDGVAARFAAATDVIWEIVHVGTNVSTALTLREALPATTTDVATWYTSVLSAQILRNEFVDNDGSLGAEPNIYYPFYLFDVDRATRQLMDEITAAGVIPEFEREF